jgi:hypothetical protein
MSFVNYILTVGLFLSVFLAISTVPSNAVRKWCESKALVSQKFIDDFNKPETRQNSALQQECTKICKEWWCTTGGHGNFTGKFAYQKSSTGEQDALKCECSYVY